MLDYETKTKPQTLVGSYSVWIFSQIGIGIVMKYCIWNKTETVKNCILSNHFEFWNCSNQIWSSLFQYNKQQIYNMKILYLNIGHYGSIKS